MKGILGDKARIEHIREAINEIEKYVDGVDFEEFVKNSMMRFACIKQIEIIGEASNYVSSETQSKFKEIDWRKIVGLRNVIVHEYFGIDYNIIWEVITDDIPELKNKIENIIWQL